VAKAVLLVAVLVAVLGTLAEVFLNASSVVFVVPLFAVAVAGMDIAFLLAYSRVQEGNRLLEVGLAAIAGRCGRVRTTSTGAVVSS
jgi:hypothetical protein